MNEEEVRDVNASFQKLLDITARALTSSSFESALRRQRAHLQLDGRLRRLISSFVVMSAGLAKSVAASFENEGCYSLTLQLLNMATYYANLLSKIAFQLTQSVHDILSSSSSSSSFHYSGMRAMTLRTVAYLHNARENIVCAYTTRAIQLLAHSTRRQARTLADTILSPSSSSFLSPLFLFHSSGRAASYSSRLKELVIQLEARPLTSLIDALEAIQPSLPKRFCILIVNIVWSCLVHRLLDSLLRLSISMDKDTVLALFRGLVVLTSEWTLLAKRRLEMQGTLLRGEGAFARCRAVLLLLQCNNTMRPEQILPASKSEGSDTLTSEEINKWKSLRHGAFRPPYLPLPQLLSFFAQPLAKRKMHRVVEVELDLSTVNL